MAGGEVEAVACRSFSATIFRAASAAAIESLKLGEAVAIAVLQDHLLTFNEGGSFQFTKFDGTPVVIS